MNDIFSMLEIPHYILQTIWILIFVFLINDLYRTTKNKVVPEWDVTSSKRYRFKRGMVSSLTRLYSKLLSLQLHQLSETVSLELCKNAAIYHNTTIFKFLQIRSKKTELQKYFKNENLISFISNPEVWTNAYIIRNRKGLFTRKNRKLNDKFIAEINRIIVQFKYELANFDI